MEDLKNDLKEAEQFLIDVSDIYIEERTEHPKNVFPSMFLEFAPLGDISGKIFNYPPTERKTKFINEMQQLVINKATEYRDSLKNKLNESN